jgi:hypothetical protein
MCDDDGKETPQTVFPIEGDVFDGHELCVARSSVRGRLLFVIAGERWPASLYLPACLTRVEVGELVKALHGWLDASGEVR